MNTTTTLEHWLNAQSGFKLLDTATSTRARADILLWIKRDLELAQHSSKSVRFQARCAELLDVVALELAELVAVPVAPEKAVA